MKRIGLLLLLLSTAWCFIDAGPVPGSTVKPVASHNTVLLVYVGSMSGSTNLSIGIHVEIDSSIGFRYEVVFEKGTSVLSHNVIFYKFAQPDQSIMYNYLTKQSHINKKKPSTSTGSNVIAVGTDKIDSFACTHVQEVNNTEKYQANYWVSKQVPGFSLIVNVLKTMGPDAITEKLGGTIFNWGGLVLAKWTGEGNNSILRLQEATTGLVFPASDFEVPKK